MKFTSAISSVASLASLAVYASASYISTKEVSGRYFVDSDSGEAFFLKGVDYQPGGSSSFEDGSDPLSDVESCTRDIVLFQELGINTIRIYSIDPSIDHDECMTKLAAAGIYLLLDVNTPIYGQSLNRDEPWTTYTESYLTHVFAVIEAFAGYNNTLGFFAGNEVVNNETSAEASPHYVKAVVRDMKEYMGNHTIRQIPVGYSSADDLDYRVSLANYLEAGPAEDAVDFYGVNSYEWCGENTFEGAGFDTLVENFENYTIPVFFSEFGCNLVQPRLFEEVASIFSNNMSKVFSGGLVYEYSQEDSDYGLVSIADDGSVTMLSDFTALSAKFATATTSGLSTASASARPTTYLDYYNNIDFNTTIPDTLASTVIADGLNSTYVRGAFVKISDLSSNYSIYDVSGDAVDATMTTKIALTIPTDSAIEQTDSDADEVDSSASASASASASSTASNTASTSDSTGSSASATSSSSSSTSSSASLSNFVSSSEKMGVAALLAAAVGLAVV
ncbi:Glucanosyltransferase-domain-containing protein [Myxozyma melibiosi]|uniref:1,3-beta-glucanosyltransferase n=1 Tax=Myxozyma melibiosi TaxID=54550 RepID=A0ABR1FDJ5_9ASCO